MKPNESDPATLPEQEHPPKKKSRLLIGLIIGAVAIVGGGLSYANYFVFRRLSPTIEKELAKTINRPLKLGDVKSFGLGGIRLGYSELPATDKASETDQAIIESVVVNYNLWTFITKRRLDLDVTLVNPQIYLEQDPDNLWVNLDIEEPDPDSEGLEVKVGTVTLKNAALQVRSRAQSGTLKQPIELEVPHGTAKLSDDQKTVTFDLNGDVARGGNVGVKGSADFESGAITLDLRAKQFAISTVTDLLPLGFTLTEGNVDGVLAINLTEGGDLKDWQGAVKGEGISMNLVGLAKPVTGADGNITFNDQHLIIKNLTGSLGALNLQGGLKVDLTGDMEGELIAEPVAIGDILETFDIEKPEFALEGKLQAAVTLAGAVEDPQLLIQAVNQDPLLFDRIEMSQFQGTLAIIGSQFIVENFIAQPTLGGQFEGKGIVQMPTEEMPRGAIAIAATGTQLPTTSLAQLYEIGTPVPLGQGRTDVIFEAPLDKPDEFVVSGTAVVPVAGGLVTATNLKVTKDRWQTPARAEGLRVTRLFDQPLASFVQNSLVNGNFFATGALTPEAGDPLEVQGEARTTLAGGTAIARNLTVKDNVWRTDVTLQGLELNELAPDLPPIDATYAGQFVAAGSLADASTDNIEAVGSGRLTFADGGLIQTNDVTVAQGQWFSKATLANVNLVHFSPQLGTYVDYAPSNGNFDVRGVVDNIAMDAVLAKGAAIAELAGGRVDAPMVTLQNGSVNARLDATGVALKPFVEQLDGVAIAKLDVVANALDPRPSQMQIQGDMRFSQGIAPINSPLDTTFAWTGSQLQIQRAIATGFAADGTMDIDIDNLGADPIGAVKQMALNIDADNVEGHLATLPLPPNAQSLEFAGKTSFKGTVQGKILQPIVNGFVQLDKVAISELAFEDRLSGQIQTRSDRSLVVALEGDTDFLRARFNQNLRPEAAELKAGDTSLDIASIRYDASGLEPQHLQLTSQNFPVALVKAIAQDQEMVQQIDFPVASIPMGGTINSRVTADLVNLSAWGDVIVNTPHIGNIRGDRVEGEFTFGNNVLALNDFAWHQRGGRYAINTTVQLPNDDSSKPIINLTGNIAEGRIEDILVAMQIFDYTDFQNLGKLTLPEYFGRSSLFDDSEDLYATADLNKPELLTEEVTSFDTPIEPGVIIPPEYTREPGYTRETFQCDALLEQHQNSGDSQFLFARMDSDLTFAERIALVSCVQTQLAQTEAAQTSLLPAELADLRGRINGDFDFTFDSEENVEANFDLRGGYQQFTQGDETITKGEPWRWGEIDIPLVVARGFLRNDTLTLRPINIQLPEGKVSFLGSFGGETQNGQLRVLDIPVAFLQKFMELPDAVGVDGLVNASATLAGTPQDPSATGTMSIKEAEINEAEINSVDGNFTYRNARLDLAIDGQLVADSEPLSVKASIPYRLPTATVAPESNDLTLSFNLKDDGFSLLNILSNGQLQWKGGTGNVDLVIDGEINPETGRPIDLIAEGRMAIADAKILAQALPDAPLTDVNGNIDFNLSDFTIRDLQGNFSGGDFNIAGTLPLTEQNPENSLAVQLNQLNFDLPQLYEGGVEGDLKIAGTALEPIIGGNINLSEGQVFLVDNQAAQTSTDDSSKGAGTKAITKNTKQNTAEKSPKQPQVDLTALTEFQNLKITLGKNIQIIRQPILNFLATGDLTMNGTLLDPRPEGLIQLKRGQVNLFATQLRLDNGYENTARFLPSLGLDPQLDVALRTSLVETPQSSLAATNPLSAEIQDNRVFSATSVGTIETIRVRAEVQGQASELNQIVQLSSSPPRTETELIALLGGTLFDTFSDSTSSTIAFANLAGSAFFNTVQDAIGNALGLSELRLFPTVITDEEQDSTLGLGAEFSMDITPSLSLSVLQILNSTEATQFGLRYRINDQIFMRGSTNLDDDSRVTVEYDLKF